MHGVGEEFWVGLNSDKVLQFIDDVGPDVAVQAAKRISDSIKRRINQPMAAEDPIWGENQEGLLLELLVHLVKGGHLSLEDAEDLVTSQSQKDQLDSIFK